MCQNPIACHPTRVNYAKSNKAVGFIEGSFRS